MELNTGKDKIYRLKCPTCQKAYVVRDAEVYSSEPEFECLFCHEKFSFDIAPSDSAPEKMRESSMGNFSNGMSPNGIFKTRRIGEPPAPRVRPLTAEDVQRIQNSIWENAERLKHTPVAVLLQRFLKYGPSLLGLILILTGVGSHSMRNLVGAGVAILVLVVGFRAIRSGGFRLRDHF